VANLRAIRNRIRSVKSTQKITKAMKMVAAARLRRAQEKVVQSTPYKKKIEELFARLTQATTNHPLLTQTRSSQTPRSCDGFGSWSLRCVQLRFVPYL
jgi:F-type H+-transporting ATPase subunit gamma